MIKGREHIYKDTCMGQGHMYGEGQGKEGILQEEVWEGLVHCQVSVV